MDKKEFLKDLFKVGLLNTFLTFVIAFLVYFLVMAVITVPFAFLVILIFVVIGYSSAFIYLKLKEKK